jgi:hypothetical protein
VAGATVRGVLRVGVVRMLLVNGAVSDDGGREEETAIAGLTAEGRGGADVGAGRVPSVQ